ncbi:hypothetical protein O0L34_g16236 [Tuta absoluta]|nr:hypothetical protein O0L34_g16236 [Tuta absoluta]
MPKIIELTFELIINRVSCPGVWLCQDGQVSLTVFALGSSYETCMLPPIFPLMFKDVFYFRKRFQASCTLSNIFCLLKDETVYCELIQWGGDCRNDRCTILAQYLGALNDVLFPPDLCSNEGVDLLMRRCRGFPGILAPKIEISTKVRLDEVYDGVTAAPTRVARLNPCGCRKPEHDVSRQKQVCHTPVFHRRQHARRRPHSAGSCCLPEPSTLCGGPTTACHANVSRSRSRISLSEKHKDQCHNYHVYNVVTPKVETSWQAAAKKCSSEDFSRCNCDLRTSQDRVSDNSMSNKVLLESRFIEPEPCHQEPLYDFKKPHKKIAPCTCEICKRYYELFHQDSVS